MRCGGSAMLRCQLLEAQCLGALMFCRSARWFVRQPFESLCGARARGWGGRLGGLWVVRSIGRPKQPPNVDVVVAVDADALKRVFASAVLDIDDARWPPLPPTTK